MLNQLQTILSQTAKHKKGRKAKSRPVFVSKRTEVLYLTALNGLIDEMHMATVDELDRLLKPQIGDSVVVADGLFDRFTAGFTNFAKSIKDKIANIAQSIAQKIVGEQKKVSDEQLAKILQKQTGIDLSSLMNDEDLEQAIKEAIGANVALINSIPQQYLDRVEMAVLNGLQRGDLNKTLSGELQKIHAITQNRAELIASDQLGKINSRLSQVRQQKLGITHYTWRTSRDERVRHSHRLRDGKLFEWDNPPADGHAGQAIRCRCVAEPYTEHLLGGKLPEEVMAEQERNTLINAEIDELIMFKSNTEQGEIFPKDKFDKLVKALKKQGVDVEASDDAQRLLEFLDAQAGYVPDEVGKAGYMLFPANPTRTQVVEEILHFGQHKKAGFKQMSALDIAKMEIEAQEKLLIVGKHLNWSDEELKEIERALKIWQNRVIELSV